MERSDHYRRFARECLEMAHTSESEKTRDILIQMAQVWFRLAEAHATGGAEPGSRRAGDATEQSE